MYYFDRSDCPNTTATSCTAHAKRNPTCVYEIESLIGLKAHSPYAHTHTNDCTHTLAIPSRLRVSAPAAIG